MPFKIHVLFCNVYLLCCSPVKCWISRYSRWAIYILMVYARFSVRWMDSCDQSWFRTRQQLRLVYYTLTSKTLVHIHSLLHKSAANSFGLPLETDRTIEWNEAQRSSRRWQSRTQSLRFLVASFFALGTRLMLWRLLYPLHSLADLHWFSKAEVTLDIKNIDIYFFF